MAAGGSRAAHFRRLVAAQFEDGTAGGPTTVAGAMEVWLRLHPRPKHLVWLERVAESVGRVYLADVGEDLLHNYHDLLLKRKYQRKDGDGKPIGEPTHYAQATTRNSIRDAAGLSGVIRAASGLRRHAC